MFSKSTDPVDVLLVEDDPGDALMVQEVLSEANPRSRFQVAPSGDVALRALRREGEFAGAARPGLVLLDLNLPGMHGLEVLSEIKADPELRTIIVVVLSSSTDPADIQRSYDQHANGYVVKPVDFDGFADMVRQIDTCFLGVIEPPP